MTSKHRWRFFRLVWTALGALVGVAPVAHPLGAQQQSSQQASTLSIPAKTFVMRFTGGAPVEASLMPVALQQKLTLRLPRVTVEQALKTIVDRAGLGISYNRDVVSLRDVVSIDVVNGTVADALRQALHGQTLELLVSSTGEMALVPAAGRAVTQEAGTVTGKIIQAKTKQPIVGAMVQIDGEQNGVRTDAEGVYRITARPGERTVTVRAVGFVRYSTRVTVVSGESVTMSTGLEASASVLDEVIVTGTVVATERKAIPTPITVINADEIEKRGITRVDQLFRGEIPGLIVLDQGTSVYSNTAGGMTRAQVYSRGSTSLSGLANPIKTYIDGVELLDPSYLGTIDPKSIERIEIITGPQAATIYGSGAMGGVMQIFTKKGTGQRRTDVTLSLKYGMLESNFSNGHTPTHTDALSVTGGSGPEFSYSTGVSYTYSGQWQPKLFARTLGASLGATHTQGPLTASASLSTTSGKNGTWRYNNLDNNYGNAARWADLSYEWPYGGNPAVAFQSDEIATSSSQTFSVNADYRATSFWQQHLTLGRSQNLFAMEPLGPDYANYTSPGSDSLYAMQESGGQRITGSFNTTFQGAFRSVATSSLTLGVTGSKGRSGTRSGCLAFKESRTVIGCYGGTSAPYVSSGVTDESWGGFGSWQLGFWNRLYITIGLRGERSPSYGDSHRLDWTPTRGIAYTIEAGDLSVKLLASYGRSTRLPSESQKRQVLTLIPAYDPSQFISSIEAPNLGPERSRGPQGGIEIYYGSIGSLTINHYQQHVDGLIQQVIVDSLNAVLRSTGVSSVAYQYQNQNVATIRQMGWEGTGSINAGPFTLKGTYSWNDSRILRQYSTSARTLLPGLGFDYIPTHTGNVTMSYAHGGTSITIVNNYIGKMPKGGESNFYYTNTYIRHKPNSAENITGLSRVAIARLGYVRSDLAVAQRLSRAASMTLNVVNLGNRYTSDQGGNNPTLGRQTSIGVTLRRP